MGMVQSTVIQPRFVDFGFARAAYDPRSVSQVQATADVEFPAPEALSNSKYNQMVQSTGKTPYPALRIIKLSQDILSGQLCPEIPMNACPLLQKLLTNCLNHAPDKRPGFGEIVKRLMDFDDFRFPNVDMMEYRLYWDRVFDETFQGAADGVIFASELSEPDDEAAFQLAKEQADGGEVDKQLIVGRMCRHGRGVRRDLTAAFKYYELAARGGDRVGMYEVSMALFRGNGILKDLAGAVAWMEKAAAEPNFTKALFIEKGWGTPVNINHAIRLLKVAADRNSRDAQYRLGLLYSEGKAVPADLPRARWTETSRWHASTWEQSTRGSEATRRMRQRI
jgi:hypothetical protein